eukprot:CAMPEP_0196806530 /NCGR_PEP_ID=MMETSP1362-20130617/6420_1 /TAXON_ID=163516 /ORGANISM="Leptocylindrus danicus, Strain CCMP1856" /LENGTH=541 /DNA_ID=CAMNT_0042180033 /DNA_START=247 /DNA_END=1872 /DNA_ORIENTATION=+
MKFHPVFQTDPETFDPIPDARYSTESSPFFLKWGLPADATKDEAPSYENENTLHLVMNGISSPPREFVNVLVEKKRRSLEAVQKDRLKQEAGLRDLIIRVALVNPDRGFKELNPSVYREFKVNSNIQLEVFTDKVLIPVMGWTRNYHGYSYTDIRDGSVFSDINNPSSDYSHGTTMYIATLKTSEARIGDLLRKRKDKLLFTYDLGDQFFHMLTLLEVIPGNEADGKFALLEGSMRCPNEDGGGCSRYQKEILDKYVAAKRDPLSTEKQRNLASTCIHRRTWPNVLGRFFPGEFDLGERENAVKEALRSRLSLQKGPMITISTATINADGSFSVQGKSMSEAFNFYKGKCGPGERIRHHTIVENPFDSRDYGKMTTEIYSIKPDEKEHTLCICGMPTDLKRCGKCCCISYCSRTCQMNDWKRHKKECKKEREKYLSYLSEKDGGPKLYKPEAEIVTHVVGAKDKLRFPAGTRVECLLADNVYSPGIVMMQNYREPDWPPSQPSAPYQIKLTGNINPGCCIYAGLDDDHVIRKLPHSKSKRR